MFSEVLNLVSGTIVGRAHILYTNSFFFFLKIVIAVDWYAMSMINWLQLFNIHVCHNYKQQWKLTEFSICLNAV